MNLQLSSSESAMKYLIKQILRKNKLNPWILSYLTKKRINHPQTKFIILAKYRVGSNYLASLLRSHSHIELHDELFNVSTLAHNISRITHPKSFLEQFYFSANSGFYAKGFKLMYKHLSCKEFEKTEWPPYISQRIKDDIETVNRLAQLPLEEIQRRCDQALKYLMRQKSFKVVHLKRRNILDTLVSTKRAFSEDTWIQETYSQDSIQLSVSECEAFFSQTVAAQDYYTNLFSRCSTYDLYYEDIIDNPEGSLSKLQDFLGVAQESNLYTTIQKQSKGHRKSTIENYDSLKKHFADSKWAIFFTED